MMDDKVEAVFGCVMVFILAIGVFLAIKFFSASGQADYCYLYRVEGDTGKMALYQHVPWKWDRPIGNYPSMPAALEAASLLKCEVK